MPQHTLHQHSRRIYWFSPFAETDRPLLGAVAGSEATLLIDAGNSIDHARQFLVALEQFPIAPPTYLLLTHWHWDHVFGTPVMLVPTFAHVETKRNVEEMARLDWRDEALDARVAAGEEIEFCRDMIKRELPERDTLAILPPNIGFEEEITLELGDLTCHLLHVGGDHSADSTIVYVPAERVAFLGDCFYPNLHHQPPCYTLPACERLVAQLLALEVDTYLLSHHDTPLSRAEFEQEAAHLLAVGQLVQETGPHRGETLQKAKQQFGDSLNEETLELIELFLAGL